MGIAVAVGLAGAIGAAARYLVDGIVQDRTSGVFPFGTTVVNVVGSFILGLLTGLVLDHHTSSGANAVLGVGFCGGLTTGRTVSWQTVRLREETGGRVALLHMVVRVGTSVFAATAGLALGLL